MGGMIACFYFGEHRHNIILICMRLSHCIQFDIWRSAVLLSFALHANILRFGWSFGSMLWIGIDL